jgi:predicted DNA-binding transcriptional regulator AlpA
MSEKQVCAELQISRVGLWKWRRAGRFPQPMRLGRSLRWYRADVAKFLKRTLEAPHAS